MTPLKVIRAKCLDCSSGNAKEVRDCRITRCPLWPFRLGTNPNRKGLQHAGSYQKTPASRADFDTNPGQPRSSLDHNLGRLEQSPISH